VWLAVLSDQLPIVALVGRYPTNKLIGRKPLRKRPKALPVSSEPKTAICGISPTFAGLSPTSGQVTYVLLTRPPLPPPEGGDRSTCMHKARRQRLS
jgi:hypothetical protein